MFLKQSVIGLFSLDLTIIFSQVSIEIKLQKGASFMADVIHKCYQLEGIEKTELIWRTDSPSKTSEFGATAIFENTYISGGYDGSYLYT